MQEVKKRLSEYNSIIKENDNLYRGAAKALGVPECALWILYALRTEHDALTQSNVCDMLYQPKQTVNSALKQLEAEGHIKLVQAKDRRSKQIVLTEKGELLAGHTADKVIAAEHEALLALTQEEQKTFIELFQKYTAALKSQITNLKK